jgi:subtilase family serine protease
VQFCERSTSLRSYSVHQTHRPMHTTQKIILSAMVIMTMGFQPFKLFADNRVSPVISEVTVYRTGAKISSAATVRISAGKSEVIFENLSMYFNPNSLQVKIKGGATLIAATFQLKNRRRSSLIENWIRSALQQMELTVREPLRWQNCASFQHFTGFA